MDKKFTVIAVKWFDKINGNTYHSVRCIRHKDGQVCVGQYQYGYGDQYRQTALESMFEAGWLPKQYHNNRQQSGIKDNLYEYERKENYPIIWTVSRGLKRECIANGTL